jgi:hypothetical protein
MTKVYVYDWIPVLSEENNTISQFPHPLLKVGPLSQACKQSKLKAKRAVGKSTCR